MSALDYVRPRRRSTIAGAAAAAIADRVQGLLRAICAWHNARTAARHLHALNDDMLRDIGMDRGQIERLVRGHAAPRARIGHADH
ncbi:MAG: DUF1127 domain-containing protein [Dongiaceae bacterium]